MVESRKVAMLLQYHPFQDARIFRKEAKSLKRLGYEMTIVAPRKEGCLFAIDGQLYKDRFLESEFEYEGIQIVCHEDQRDSLSVMANNIANSGISPLTDSLSKKGLEVDADIYHAHEFLSLYSGVLIKRALKAKGKNVKLIYDSHEIIPDPYSEIPYERKKVLYQMLLKMLKEVDVILAVSDSMKAWYIEQNPDLQVYTIYNSPISQLPPASSVSKPNKTPFVVCFEGNIDMYRGNWDKVQRITERCMKKIDIQFKIIGGARDGHTLKVPDHLKNHIFPIGWVKYEELPLHMQDVDLGWIDLRSKSLNFEVALPNKLFSFLSNGVPVLCNLRNEMETLLTRHQCGLVINKKEVSAEEYAEAICYLAKHPNKMKEMGKNARDAVASFYSWQIMEQKLDMIYQRLLMPMASPYRF